MAGSTYLPQIDYTARTFDTIKSALLDHVKYIFPNDWQDFTEGNLGVAILELVAYVGDNLSFYLDRTANEMYLATAAQRQNVINLVKLIGYSPATAAAASAPIRARVQIAQTNIITIPAYTSFSDKAGSVWELLENQEIAIGVTDTYHQQITNEVLATGNGTTLIFALTTANANLVLGSVSLKVTIGGILYTITIRNDGVIVLPFGGSGLLNFTTGHITLTFISTHAPDNATTIRLTYQWDQSIKAYQGKTRLDQFSSTGAASQTYALTNSQVLITPLIPTQVYIPDPSRFEVWVGDPGAPFGTGTGTLWTRVDSLLSAIPTDTVYQVLIDDQDKISILFGDGLNGAVPIVGSGNVNIVYRTGGGTIGNIAVNYIDSNVTGSSGLLSISVKVNNYEIGSGGQNRESVDEIRVNAPAYLRTNDTATTEQDYDTLASQYSNSGAGAIARAKARLTPSVTFQAKVIHSNYIMGVVPVTTPLTYYLSLPATPAIVTTIDVYYTVAGVVRHLTAATVGVGLASLGGDASVNALTRLRYDQQDYSMSNPTGFLGTGAQFVFNGTLAGFPIMPSTVLVHYTVGTTDYIGYDNGLGFFNGTHINAGVSTIVYSTGAISITFTTAPVAASLISFDYQSCLYLLLVAPPDVGTDIGISMESGPSTKILPSNNVEVYTWAQDGNADLVPPGVSLKDDLKSYLDLRRVLGTSVQIFDGFNTKVNLNLECTFNPAVSSTETTIRIVDALDAYFTSISEVQPGIDVPLAGIYNSIYPLLGVDDIVIQDITLRVSVATGNGYGAVYKNHTEPGTYVSIDKLPAIAGLNKINIYRGTTLIGTSSAATPVAVLSGSGILPGSTFNITTGAFVIVLSSVLALNELLYIDFYPDAIGSVDKYVLWNTVIEPWEIAVLGDVYLNGIKVR